MTNKPFVPSGPIPGENFTSNTKNYPWHRPPDITDMDAGIEAVMKQLATKETSYALLTILQTGVPIVTAADIFLTNAIGSGKFTPDMALLLGGPVTHIMKIMADDAGIKYDLGLDDKTPHTIAFLQEKAKISPAKAVNAVENVKAQIDSIKGQAQGMMAKGGFMGPKPGEPQEQESQMHEQGAMDPQEDMATEGEVS